MATGYLGKGLAWRICMPSAWPGESVCHQRGHWLFGRGLSWRICMPSAWPLVIWPPKRKDSEAQDCEASDCQADDCKRKTAKRKAAKRKACEAQDCEARFQHRYDSAPSPFSALISSHRMLGPEATGSNLVTRGATRRWQNTYQGWPIMQQRGLFMAAAPVAAAARRPAPQAVVVCSVPNRDIV